MTKGKHPQSAPVSTRGGWVAFGVTTGVIAGRSLLGMLTLVPPLAAGAQESPCDRGLEALSRGPQGYTLRGDRCEGIYVQQVAGTTLILASLTQSFEDYDLTSGDDLIIEWTARGAGTLRVRAQGIKRDLYYRMDAVRPSETQVYRWHSDVLAAQHVTRADIGVLGWTRESLGGADRDVFIPLRIRQHHPRAATVAYDLVLFPTVALKEVYVSLAAVGADGVPNRFIKQGAPLGYGYYPAERPVNVRLRDPGDTGIYYVEIGADLAAGGSATLRHWVYHARGPHAN
jgi:hypothetical protein